MTAPTQSVAACCAGIYELPLTRLVLGDSFHPGGSALTRQLAQLALVNRDSLVLDVASGIGMSARTLAGHFGCRVVGVDYSARNSAAACGDHPTSFTAGSALELPFPDHTFDVVMCECALCTFTDQPLALSEMYRVLKHRGRLAVSDMTLNSAIPPELDNSLGHAVCIAGARSIIEYGEVIEQAGFKAVRVRDVSHVLGEIMPDVEKRLNAAISIGSFGETTAIDQRDVERTLGVAKAFVASGGLGYVMVTGRK
ncbi:MAG: class I SAM-dependent methyltransferase [Gemmatimonadales bacterium]